MVPPQSTKRATGPRVAGRGRVVDTLSLWIVGSTAVVGLTGGAHCAAMCGPIAACAGGSGRYHAARIAGYTAVGALAGAIGARGVDLVSTARTPLAVGAAGLALGAVAVAHFGRKWLGRRAPTLVRSLSPERRGLLLGALTPLLPCGLSLSVVLFALATGSAAVGALVMAAFAVSSAPSLVAIGWLRRWVSAKLRPAGQKAFEAALLAAAAAVVLLRLVDAFQGASCH